jgi:thioredoxin 1
MIKNVTHDMFQKEVYEYNGPVVVTFTSPGCGPCRQLQPQLELLQLEHPALKVLKVDITEESELAQHFRIASVPTTFFFSPGVNENEMRGHFPGATSLAKLREFLFEAIEDSELAKLAA